MTEETLNTIQKVANKLANKYVFDIYDEDDIKQEIFLLCVEALPRYDNTRPLENFLYVHVNNRLKTFIRNNYYIDSGTWVQDRKKLVKRTISIDDINLDEEEQAVIDFNYGEFMVDEILALIDSKLPNHLRADYLRLKAGVSIPTSRKNNVISVIREIITEAGYEEDYA